MKYCCANFGELRWRPVPLSPQWKQHASSNPTNNLPSKRFGTLQPGFQGAFSLLAAASFREFSIMRNEMHLFGETEEKQTRDTLQSTRLCPTTSRGGEAAFRNRLMVASKVLCKIEQIKQLKDIFFHCSAFFFLTSKSDQCIHVKRPNLEDLYEVEK